MLQPHKDIFFFAANTFNCWIGLREPNELSDPWIGKQGYTSKSMTCKAKSADNPSSKLTAGLVVNPVIRPEAFLDESLSVAKKKWEEFSNGGLPSGYICDEKGFVRYHGLKIHADFDLMTVTEATEVGKMENTSNKRAKNLRKHVAVLVNNKIGCKMIQHGSEFEWKGGVGARESEQVYFFGPNRQFKVAMSSMPTKAGSMH